MHWCRLILPVKSRVVELIARWHHLFFTSLFSIEITDVFRTSLCLSTVRQNRFKLKSGAATFEGLYFLLTYAERLNQFLGFLKIWAVKRNGPVMAHPVCMTSDHQLR